jgi:hypothetical protein
MSAVRLSPEQREQLKTLLSTMPTVERLRHVQRLETEGKREEASVLREICLEIPSAAPTESVPPVSASVPAENMGFDAGQLAPVVASVLVGVVSFSARVLGALVMGLVVGGADILRARNERTLSPGERDTMYARQANRVVPERAGPADQPRVRTTTITETF